MKNRWCTIFVILFIFWGSQNELIFWYSSLSPTWPLVLGLSLLDLLLIFKILLRFPFWSIKFRYLSKKKFLLRLLGSDLSARTSYFKISRASRALPLALLSHYCNWKYIAHNLLGNLPFAFVLRRVPCKFFVPRSISGLWVLYHLFFVSNIYR